MVISMAGKQQKTMSKKYQFQVPTSTSNDKPCSSFMVYIHIYVYVPRIVLSLQLNCVQIEYLHMIVRGLWLH